MPGGRRGAPAGQHFLAPDEARRLVGEAAIDRGDLVFDIGAGTGEITLALARVAARVVAVERDHRLAEVTRRRTRHLDNVTVVVDDALKIPFPRRPFRVVANLPFAGSTAIVRRLLHPATPLASAQLVVARGAAMGWTTAPTRREAALWAAWHDLALGRAIPGSRFRPRPSVDAAVLSVSRRVQPEVSLRHLRAYEHFLAAAFRPGPIRRNLRYLATDRQFTAAVRRVGLARDVEAAHVPAARWHCLFRTLTRLE